MSVKTRVALIISGVFSLYLVIYVVLHFFWAIPELRSVEEGEALKDMQNVVSAINSETAHLDSICRDWAYWDDMYAYVIRPTGEFTRSNLNTETLVNAGIDLFFIFNRNGSLVFSAVNDKDKIGIDSSELLQKRAELFSMLFRPNAGPDRADESSITGILHLKHSSIICAVRPIRTSTGTGSARGVLLMGRFLDKSLIRKLNSQTNTDFTIYFPEEITEKEYENVTLLKSGRKYVLTRTGNKLQVYTLIRDMSGKEHLIIKMKSVGKIIKKQYVIMNYTLGLGLLANLVATIILIFLIQRFILGPVINLTSRILTIRSSGDLSIRAESKSRNEMGLLAYEFNRLLDELSLAHEDLTKANEELQSIAVIDSLTGVSNRRRFDEVMDLEWRRARREKFPISLVMCDVDNFKLYNDTYGHPPGDECLRSIAQVLYSLARRPGDLCARYGGEEFILIMPNTDSRGTRQMAERIRETVAALEIPHSRSSTGFVTISLGASTVVPAQSMDPAEFIKTVDKALYEAKSKGRNRSVFREYGLSDG